MPNIIVRTTRGDLNLQSRIPITGYTLVDILADAFNFTSVLKNEKYFGQLYDTRDLEVHLHLQISSGEYRYDALETR